MKHKIARTLRDYLLLTLLQKKPPPAYTSGIRLDLKSNIIWPRSGYGRSTWGKTDNSPASETLQPSDHAADPTEHASTCVYAWRRALLGEDKPPFSPLEVAAVSFEQMSQCGSPGTFRLSQTDPGSAPLSCSSKHFCLFCVRTQGWLAILIQSGWILNF